MYLRVVGGQYPPPPYKTRGQCQLDIREGFTDALMIDGHLYTYRILHKNYQDIVMQKKNTDRTVHNAGIL